MPQEAAQTVRTQVSFADIRVRMARTSWYEMTFTSNAETMEEDPFTATQEAEANATSAHEAQEAHEGDEPRDTPFDLARDARALHENGTCDPCVFLASAHGCSKGLDCEFCHLHHPEANSSSFTRPRKERRMRMKRHILQHLQGPDPDEMQQALQREARRSPYMRFIIPSQINLHLGEPTPASTSDDNM